MGRELRASENILSWVGSVRLSISLMQRLLVCGSIILGPGRPLRVATTNRTVLIRLPHMYTCRSPILSPKLPSLSVDVFSDIGGRPHNLRLCADCSIRIVRLASIRASILKSLPNYDFRMSINYNLS